MCSGKIYFELEERRKKDNQTMWPLFASNRYIALQAQLDALYKKYSKAIWHWVGREPLNMGAATFLRMNLKNINFYIISHKASAVATATGHSKFHAKRTGRSHRCGIQDLNELNIKQVK